MIQRWIPVIIFISLSFFCFADPTSDPVIRNVEYIGVKYTAKRFETESPLKKGTVWNAALKSEFMTFITQLQKEKIIEDGAPVIVETSPEQGIVDLKIALNEQLPFFTIALPFYSTTGLLKVKLKYWQFYVDGNKVPLEGQIEFLQKENINVYIKTNEPIWFNKRTSLEFAFSGYTTTFNYLATYSNPAGMSNDWNKEWRNGIDNFFAGLTYKIPKAEITFSPRFGLGYANLLVTDPSGDLNAVKNQYHSLIITPSFSINIPIDPIRATIFSQLGFGYKYETVLDRDPTKNYNKQEISLSLLNNNPKDMPDPLASPVTVYSFSMPITPIRASFSTGFKFALKQSFTNSLSGGSVIALLLQKEIDPTVFEKTILENIDDPGIITLIKNSYPYDSEKKKYILNDAVSSSDKENIWDSLVDIGYISNNGFMVNPNIRFSFRMGTLPMYLIPEVSLSYSNKSGTRSDGTTALYYNALTLSPVLTFQYTIPVIDTFLSIFTQFRWQRIWYNNTETGENDIRLVNKISLPSTGFSVEKKMPLEDWFIRLTQASKEVQAKSGHYFKLQSKVELDPLASGKGENLGLNPSSFVTVIDARYQLYLPTWKDSRFKLRMGLFSMFNKVNDKIFDEMVMSNWLRGKPAGDDYFGGWFGFVMNLEYWFNLLNFDTPKIGSISIKKQLSWLLFWVIYADGGVALNDKKTNYTFSLGNFNILPYFTLGTAFRAYPRFVPLQINFEINYKLYNFLKNRDTFGNLYFEFSVSRVLDNSNWFSL